MFLLLFVFSSLSLLYFVFLLICALRSHNERPFIFREFARFHRICLDFPLFNAEKSDYFFVSCFLKKKKKQNTPIKVVAIHTQTHSHESSSLIYFQYTVRNSLVANALGMLIFKWKSPRLWNTVRQLVTPFNCSIDSYFPKRAKKKRKKNRKQREEEKVACFEMLGTHFSVHFSNVRHNQSKVKRTEFAVL